MKQLLIFATLVLSAASTGNAQDNAAVEEAATAADGTQNSLLHELDWMVGNWLDEGEESTIITSCSWTENGKFLTRSFRVIVDGETSLSGTQMIGWDPIAAEIRSWTFDSEGGVGEGRWLKDGNKWLVKASFVLANGERASALNVITFVDQDTFRWQSIDREVGGELLPSIPEVTIVRQEPHRTEQASSNGVDQSGVDNSAPVDTVGRSHCGSYTRCGCFASKSRKCCRFGRR